MIIAINNINNTLVDFSTKYGSARGNWKSNNNPYKKKYAVEFDYDGIITIEKISFCEKKYEINSVNNEITLCGKIIEIDDSSLLLYIGDTIILFAISNECYKKFKVNDYVCIKVPSLDLYDENIPI